MDTHATDRPPDATPAREVATERVRAAIQGHLCGGEVAPLYLATGQLATATSILATVAAEVRSAGRGERLLACAGTDFVALWRDTLRREMTPIIRRALAAKRAILLDGLEALRGEPFAQAELARLITSGHLVVLAGHEHAQRVGAWSPSLAAALSTAVPLCLHEGPCIADADAWAQLLSYRRTAPVALARQVVMRLLREEGLTAERIGHLLGRDHSTVLYGDARVRQRAAREAHIHHDLATLRRDAMLA